MKSWAAMILAAVVVGSTVPPAGPVGATGLGSSAPTLGTNAIISPDDRFQVSPTTSFPASATVLLTFTGGRCTGFMISPDTLATAAHCVHSGPGGSWHTNVVATPGFDGVTAPYGSCMAKSLHTSSSWTTNDAPENDYAAVKLNCPLGNVTGWYKLDTLQLPVGACTINQAYPVDRPGQWASKDYIRNATDRLLYYQHDSNGGQAGSPIFATDEPDRCGTYPKPRVPLPPRTVMGIFRGYAGNNLNYGVRFTYDVISSMQYWSSLP
ncbi:hypothetical protein Misp04_11790 [Micromonospora sp. NBRC 101691]|nr:hypothetical protein Misp04_11790 [Micromonospora sp. NBRC 101691]